MNASKEPTQDPRRVREPLTPEEVGKFEGYASEIFHRLGLEQGPGTETTPQRWLKAMVDMTSGYDGDEKIRTVFPNECPGCPPDHLAHIVEGPIHLMSSCEHHIVPIIGEAYVAAHSLIGISKFVRLVRVYARRFTSQERITQQVAGDLMKLINPQGTAVLIKAHHLCSIARGVREVTSATTTMAFRGVYLTDLHRRDEFTQLVAHRMGNY
ncbi:MAG: GTP cyclohydrolase I [Candidatus Kerfeldbacteria bacterium]|nr:GTP cyclohydrolase I [Candidatus Kerfeldbacteria bacterium]